MPLADFLVGRPSELHPLPDISRHAGPLLEPLQRVKAGGSQHPALSTLVVWPDRVKILNWYMNGKIHVDDLITHTLPLDVCNKG